MAIKTSVSHGFLIRLGHSGSVLGIIKQSNAVAIVWKTLTCPCCQLATSFMKFQMDVCNVPHEYLCIIRKRSELFTLAESPLPNDLPQIFCLLLDLFFSLPLHVLEKSLFPVTILGIVQGY